MPPQPVDERPNTIVRGISDAQNFTPFSGSREEHATLLGHHFNVVFVSRAKYSPLIYAFQQNKEGYLRLQIL